MTTTTSEPLPDTATLRRRARSRVRYDRLEIYYDEGSRPNGRLYRWRWRSGANGEQTGKAHKSWTQRDRCLANARSVTGYDLAHDPDFVEPQPGIDGEVSVWLIDPKARRGYPG